MSKDANSTVALDTSSLPELPSGWVWARVDEVGEVKLGRQRSPEHHNGPHMRPYLRVANVYEDRIDLSDVLRMNFTPEEFETYQLRHGDILLNEGQSLEWVGRPALYRDELPGACFQNTLVRFRPSKGVLPQYSLMVFRYYLHSRRFQRLARWTVNIAHLGAQRFAEIEFPLAPLNEQHRIVAKIEELFSDLEAGVAALERVKTSLKRYRIAVLQAAVTGKLTAAWRARHSDAEPASVLLQRILSERRQQWEKDQLAKYAQASKEPPKGWQAKYSEPVGPDASTLPDLPKGWQWTSIGQLLHGIEGGKSFKCLTRMAEENEWGVIKVSAMTWGKFLEREQKAIPAGVSFDPRHEIKPNDLLISRSNTTELVGASVLVAECRQRLLLSDKSLRLLVSGLLSRRWFHRALSSPVARKQLSAMATGTSDSMRNVSQDKIDSVAIPLAPLDEQHEIVAEVERRLSIIDGIEAQVDANLKRASRLRQCVLKRAFEGRLVPQVVTDEPASVLLERIRQQRLQQSQPGDGTVQDGASKPKRKDGRGVFYRRAAVVCYVVKRLSSHKHFGRTQLEKILHLSQSHLGIDLSLEFKRYAAGPFDEVIYKLEGAARKNQWFTKQDRPKIGVTYQPAEKTDELCGVAVSILGDKQSALDQLLDHFTRMDTDQAELLATAYAAWNDLLLDGRPANEEAIIKEIYGWDESKVKFDRPRILACLEWMRKQGYIPTGTGQRTQVLERKTRLPSKRKARKPKESGG